MFNLIMQGVSWGNGRDTFPATRVFEYTDAELAADFRDGNQPDLDKLIRLPCLFMVEGLEDELAHVGTITQAQLSRGNITFEFTVDPTISPIKNSLIYRNRRDFDMPEDFEFSRTHWAVKNVNLYKMLLRISGPVRPRPRVFNFLPHEQIDSTLASVMMPFDASFDRVYDAIKAACTGANLRTKRGDEIWEHPQIMQDLASLIDRSRVVICDCTNRNANVFYEIGIAHTLGREVVLITQNDHDVPFDLRHLRYIKYLNNVEGREGLTEQLKTRLATILRSA